MRVGGALLFISPFSTHAHLGENSPLNAGMPRIYSAALPSFEAPGQSASLAVSRLELCW